ncbi:MAG: hypothetical protein IPN32_25480 [Deltaproteobacteria bacterium]|nr:hypothetical protein [Deltaproteobacteria bacterium]
MQTRKQILGVCKALALVTALALPQVASAGKGASYASLRNAIATGNRDSILAEVERAEKLPCGPCVDLVTPLIDHDDAAVRDVAAWWLAKRGIRDQIRDQMFERLAGGDAIAARNAAQVLGRFAHPDALMPLELAIHDDALGDEARVAAAIAVGDIGDYRGKDVLEAAITSESAAVREAAARACGTSAATSMRSRWSTCWSTPRRASCGRPCSRSGRCASARPSVRSPTSCATPRSRRRCAATPRGRWARSATAAREVLKAVEADDASMLVRGAARAALQSLR